MKYLLLGLLSSLALSSTAQITLQATDMPNVGDQLLVSNGLPLPAIDLTLTGANQTWDFSQLIPVSQDTIGFVAVNSTASFFQLAFGLPFSPNFSTIVSPIAFPDSLGGISVSDVLGFYRESNTEFKQTGYGATLNNTPIPITFSTPDIIYKFPLTFSNQDSSSSGFVMSLPGTVYFSRAQKRVNEVDGWGTLITPFGTFQALRQVSILFAHDSISLDSTQLGLDQPVTKEYKWLVKNTVAGKPMGIPVLQINTQTFQGQEAITSVQYRDSVRVFGPQAAPIDLSGIIQTGPNPFENVITISLVEPLGADASIDVLNVTGQSVLKSTLRAGAQHKTLAIPTAYCSELYFLVITTGKGKLVEKLLHANR